MAEPADPTHADDREWTIAMVGAMGTGKSTWITQLLGEATGGAPSDPQVRLRVALHCPANPPEFRFILLDACAEPAWQLGFRHPVVPLTGTYGFLRRALPDLLPWAARRAPAPEPDSEPASPVLPGLTRRASRLLDRLAGTLSHGPVALIQRLLARLASLPRTPHAEVPEPAEPPGELVCASRRPSRGPNHLPVSTVLSIGGEPRFA
jgi:hypothetical protein